MVVSRVSTATQFTATISQITEKQADLTKLQAQIASGQKSDTYTGLDSAVGRVIDLESKTVKLERYIQNNTLISNRLKVQDTSISQMQQIATELKSLLTTENSSSGNTLDISTSASALLQQVQDNLNVKFSGRYLFAGSKTDQPPITEESLGTTNVINGEATASYYLGDDLKFAAQASDDLSLSYGVTGDNVAFKDLIAALNKAKEIETFEFNSTESKAAIEEALNFVDSAVEGLITVNAEVRTNVVRIDSVNSQHTEVKLQLQGFLDEEFGTDVIEASINLSSTQATLTAILQTFARISQLSLTDFLR